MEIECKVSQNSTSLKVRVFNEVRDLFDQRGNDQVLNSIGDILVSPRTEVIIIRIDGELCGLTTLTPRNHWPDCIDDEARELRFCGNNEMLRFLSRFERNRNPNFLSSLISHEERKQLGDHDNQKKKIAFGYSNIYEMAGKFSRKIGEQMEELNLRQQVVVDKNTPGFKFNDIFLRLLALGGFDVMFALKDYKALKF